MEMSEEIKEIAKAINKLQSELDFALKDVQAFKYKYADMAAIWDVLKEPMTRNGLMISQDAYTNEIGACVQTIVIHAESGQWIKSGVLNVPGDRTAHSCGSSITYGKRYQLSALLGIQVDNDDDGKRAQDESKKNTEVPQKPAPALTEKEMNKWAESLPFDMQDIEGYLHARAKHFKHDVKVTAYEMKNNPSLFKKNIETWIEQQE